jgi:hypothetical protein
MGSDDHGGLVQSLREIEIARQIGAIVLDELQVGPGDDFIILRPCTYPRQH